MPNITCPKCGETFKVDESYYAAILSQIRTQEFDNEVHAKIDQLKEQYKTELKLQEEKFKNETNLELSKKDSEISELKSQLKNQNTATELAVSKAIAPIEKERNELLSDLKIKEAEAKNKEQSMREQYEGAMKLKDEEIERLKDLKSKLSTKMVGETLEQHCEIEFNKLRATGFQNAYFEKDNDVSKSGSKGDYIFREEDENGTEIVSIMFEMKNENETTNSKHKNEDFLKELDKDRNEKHCEYAVLVSLLEADNELYNTGIVDMSHRFPKMYVIRPQFFIPMITLLRNAALNSMKYKNELAIVKNQDIDITNFEKDMNDWKASWASTMKNAGKKHLEAIEQINKAIKDLEKTRDALMMSDKHLGIAEGKLHDLSIKRLTRNNPTMAEKFKNLEP